MKNKKVLLTILILAISVVMMTGCGSEEDTSHLTTINFVLEWAPNTNHTGVYVALARGYYEAAGLDVRVLTPPETGATALVASGRAEFGVSFQEAFGVELTLAEPMPLTAVAAIISHNNSGIISMRERGIDDFSMLEGMTYASWQAPGELEILRQTMTDAGGDFNQLLTVPAPATDAIAMIRTGLVDAVWVYEGWDVIAARIAGVDYNFIRFAEASPVLDFYTPFIVVNNDFKESYPEIVRAFIQATAAGYQFAIENPREAAQILLDAVPELPADLIFASQEFLAGEYAGADGRWGFFDEARWTAFFDWMYEQEIIPTPLGSNGFTNEFL